MLTAEQKKLLNDFALQQPALNNIRDPFPSSALQIGDILANNFSNELTREATYDFAESGGAVGASLINFTVPTGSIVTRIYTRQLSNFTSGGLATVAIKAGSSVLKAATAFNDASYTGLKDASPASPILVTAAGQLQLDIAVADLTGGKIRIMLSYIQA